MKDATSIHGFPPIQTFHPFKPICISTRSNLFTHFAPSNYPKESKLKPNSFNPNEPAPLAGLRAGHRGHQPVMLRRHSVPGHVSPSCRRGTSNSSRRVLVTRNLFLFFSKISKVIPYFMAPIAYFEKHTTLP
jgi:hypothetical protein